MAATALADPPVVPGLPEDLDPALAGRVLLSELNCTACHAGEIRPRGAPNLEEAASRLNRNRGSVSAMALFSHTAGRGLMPNVVSRQIGEREVDLQIANQIEEYVLSLGGAGAKPKAVDPEAVERGRKLYHEVGCVACHDPEDQQLPGSRELYVDGTFYLDDLTAFLEDPLKFRPSGRMPDGQLSHWEAADIASYLLRDQKPTIREAAPVAVDQAAAAEGKRHYERVGCAQCHEPENRRDDFAKPLADLNPAGACEVAEYELSETQRKAIAAALADLDAELSVEAQIELEMIRLNCFACHERGGRGGPAAARDEFFTTTNLNLGDQARIPPSLDHVGAKLDPKSLRKVLVSGERVRPYMNTRMPQYGAANVEKLFDLLARDELPKAEFTRVEDEKAARNAGFELAGDKNLSCVACHTWKGESATTLKAVELTTMAERLQENWFHLYLRNPHEFHPTTIMPNFWPNGKSTRPEILGGDTGQQIDALWQYLKRGREARTPSGIRREPIEYGPIDGEAVMLRRQYNGIGKRGIGVGYPAGINLAFDASQMRLGTIWKGDFGEMSGVWRGQGSGNVHERSREIVRFALGPDLAMLESVEAAWPVLEKGQRAEGFQFKGYTLDQKQRPTFRYAFAGLMIEDNFLDQAEGPALVRTLRFDRPAPEGLFFRFPNGEQLAERIRIGIEEERILREDDAVISLAGKRELIVRYKFIEK